MSPEEEEEAQLSKARLLPYYGHRNRTGPNEYYYTLKRVFKIKEGPFVQRHGNGMSETPTLSQNQQHAW